MAGTQYIVKEQAIARLEAVEALERLLGEPSERLYRAQHDVAARTDAMFVMSMIAAEQTRVVAELVRVVEHQQKRIEALEASRVFISEDCERLSVEALLERLKAVTEGDDRVAKVLHARYVRFRLEAIQEEADRLVRERRVDPRAAERARDRRHLQEALERVEEGLQDRTRAERAQKLTQAAQRSRQVASAARQRLREADGTEEAARQAARKRVRQAL
jgi:hypothetical protein